MAEFEWSYKSIPDFYTRVRGLLNNASDISLPDQYIDMPERAPYAEEYVKTRVHEWETLDSKKTSLFHMAIIYKTASFFEEMMSSQAIKKKELPTIKLEYFSNNQPDNYVSFADKAEALIAEINGESPQNFFGFMVT